MGSLIRVWKTIPMPPGATVGRNGTVTWTVRGKKRTGKLSATGRVSVQVDTWTAKFKDETGTVRRIPTKETSRPAAAQVLAQHEKEVARIKAGVITREELDRVQAKHTPLDDMLERFRTKMIADGTTARHIGDTLRKITSLFAVCEIDSLAKIRRETVEQWVANELKSKIRSVGTINSYVIAVKSFVQYLVDTDILANHPVKFV
jgi:hypothetical protein